VASRQEGGTGSRQEAVERRQEVAARLMRSATRGRGSGLKGLLGPPAGAAPSGGGVGPARSERLRGRRRSSARGSWPVRVP
jgi:hypothetical protein